MQKYRVSVMKVSYQVDEVKVRARSEGEALDKAEKLAIEMDERGEAGFNDNVDIEEPRYIASHVNSRWLTAAERDEIWATWQLKNLAEYCRDVGAVARPEIAICRRSLAQMKAEARKQIRAEEATEPAEEAANRRGKQGACKEDRP